jgi:hypothetical protein
MHFDQLLRLRGSVHEEKYPFRAPIEGDGCSLLNDNRLFLCGIEHLIGTEILMVLACLAPASQRNG